MRQGVGDLQEPLEEPPGATFELGRTIEFAAREHPLRISYTQDAASWVVVGDGDDQLLRGARFPHKGQEPNHTRS